VSFAVSFDHVFGLFSFDIRVHVSIVLENTGVIFSQVGWFCQSFIIFCSSPKSQPSVDHALNIQEPFVHENGDPHISIHDHVTSQDQSVPVV